MPSFALYASFHPQMVADSQLAPKKPQRGGKRTRIPLPIRLKVRSLYIVQQLSPAEIGFQLGFTRQQVQGLIAREHWTPVKNNARRSLEQRHDTRLKAEVDEIHEAFAIKTEELGLGTLDKAGEALGRKDPNAARDLQALSQTAKNFYGIARQARGMDTQSSEGKGGAVVVFLGDLPRVSREEKRVEAIDLPPTQCPIPAIPMPQGEALPSGEGKDTPLATD